jgi:hypothetical protein
VPYAQGGARSGLVVAAETMAARTAPGTELDRPRTLSGTSPRSKVVLVLGVGVLAAGILVAVLTGILRPGAATEQEPSNAAPSARLIASSTADAPLPAASTAPESSGTQATELTKPAPAPPPSAEPRPTAKIKRSGPTTKALSPKTSPNVVRTPKYTRD